MTFSTFRCIMYTQIQEILLLWILTKELNIGKLFEKIGRKALETKLTIISNMLLWKFQYVSQLPPTRVPGRYLAAFFYPIIHAFWFKNSNVLNNSNSVCKIWINTQFCAARTRKAFRKKKRKL